MRTKLTPLNTATLKASCVNLAVNVPEEILPRLEIYLTLLMQWNKSMNLVGAKNWQDCLEKLLVDSFYVSDFIKKLHFNSHENIWDLGAGAGLPGIVLRMLWTEGNYHLIEAREKRALFLQTVLTRIKLKHTNVFHGRAETFFAQNQAADIVISRAFMPWRNVLELVENNIKPMANIIFLALEAAPKQELSNLGWQLMEEQNYMVDDSVRTLWAVQKIER